MRAYMCRILEDCVDFAKFEGESLYAAKLLATIWQIRNGCDDSEVERLLEALETEAPDVLVAHLERLYVCFRSPKV